MKKRNKKLTVALLALLGLVSAGGTFAYWQGQVLAPADVSETVSINIGTAKDVITVLNVTETLAAEEKKLVPAGQVNNSVGGEGENVDQLTVNYEVTWTGDVANAAANGTLSVTAEASNPLVQVEVGTFDSAMVLDGAAVTIPLTITMNEPADEAEYTAIAGSVITITVTFSLAV